MPHSSPAQRRTFAGPDGVAVPSVAAREMREVRRIAAAQTGPSPLQMSEHAGIALAAEATRLLGDRWRAARIIVLAGGGETGAGGVAAARHLANRGVEVAVVSLRAPAEADGALGQQLMTLGEAPARLLRWSEAFDAAAADLIVDAVLGPDLDGPPRAAVMALIRAAGSTLAPVLSLDVPSGIDPDGGAAPGVHVRPVRTLALGLPMQGLTRANAGDLVLADLGIPPGVYARAGLAFAPIFGPGLRIPLDYPEE